MTARTDLCVIDGCTKPRLTKVHGWCMMHHTRWKRHGDPLASLRHRVEACDWHDWGRVIGAMSLRSADCWEWSGDLNSNGYGRVSLGNRRYYAHRKSYELAVGPIPRGMTVDHLCWNTACVRPDHLQLLTNVDNALRRRRFLLNLCMRGHELTVDNTYSRSMSRRCKTCANAQQRLRRASR